MSRIVDRPEFIRRNTRLMAVPQVPEISLHLADDATDLWLKTEADLDATGLPPPFWAFAWAGGQALARYILDHPETVAGARVLDLASGSGLVGIAAARSGAASVTANDIDAFALDAIVLNAAANRVTLATLAGDLMGREAVADRETVADRKTVGGRDTVADRVWEVVLAADIFYERDTAGAVTAWLARLAAAGTQVLVGDPGRSYFDTAVFTRIASYDVPVLRSLEDAELKRSSVWRLVGQPASVWEPPAQRGNAPAP